MRKDLSKINKLVGTSKIVKDLSWYKKVVVPKIVNNYEKYNKVSKITGVPVSFIACIHAKESGSDLGQFKSYLGNGEKIIGTGKESRLVPSGRGPFMTWESGAIDAIQLKDLHKIGSWSLEEAIYQWERYNGFGYAKRGKNSPYVWSFVNHGVGAGKYVADGQYDPLAVSKNIGTYALYTLLVKADSRFTIGERNEPREQYSRDIKEENQRNNSGEVKGFWALLGNFILNLFTKAAAKSPLDEIKINNPSLDERSLESALKWHKSSKVKNKDYIFFVDFDKRDTEKRLYLIDMKTYEAETFKVAHGKKSDSDKDGWADNFSNVSGSHRSSLGAMVFGKEYGKSAGGWSKFKYARIIHGLEKGRNDKVRSRAIVFHEGKYVEWGGDSLGCFTVTPDVAKRIIKLLEGCLLYAHHDSLWEGKKVA